MGRKRVRKIKARATSRKKKADWYELGGEWSYQPGTLAGCEVMVFILRPEDSQEGLRVPAFS